MTKEEIEAKIEELKEATEEFSEPQKTFKQGKVNELNMMLYGMALDEIAAKMDSISLPEIESMEEHIEAAKDATKAQSQRVEAFNNAYEFIKGALSIAV